MLKNGTIFSLRYNRYVGSIGNNNNYIFINYPNYKYRYIHQYIWMVANGCDIPEGYEIHHIDGNKLNNSIYNLELIEKYKHLSLHHTSMKHTEETKKKIKESNIGKYCGSKKVAQYTLDGELVKVWGSIKETTNDGFSLGCVSKCCQGKRKTHKGYVWKYL